MNDAMMREPADVIWGRWGLPAPRPSPSVSWASLWGGVRNSEAYTFIRKRGLTGKKKKMISSQAEGREAKKQMCKVCMSV